MMTTTNDYKLLNIDKNDNDDNDKLIQGHRNDDNHNDDDDNDSDDNDKLLQGHINDDNDNERNDNDDNDTSPIIDNDSNDNNDNSKFSYITVNDNDDDDNDDDEAKVKDIDNKNHDSTASTTSHERILAWLALLLAILSGSLIGPTFKWLQAHKIPPVLAAAWRCQTMSIFLIPLAIAERCKKANQIDWFTTNTDLNYSIFVHTVISGFAWCANLLFWVEGLRYTTTVRASIICGTHPLMLIIYLFIKGVRVSYLEWGGIFMAMLGGLVTVKWNESEIAAKNELYGDMLCILSGLNSLFFFDCQI